MARILIVDDSEDLVDGYKSLLTRKGFEVDTAFDGERGLARVREFRPDVVLLDMMMPDVDGLEFLARLPETGVVPAPRVIANSGFDGCRAEAMRRGAHVFLRKPVSVATLLAAITDAARGAQVADADIADNEAHVETTRRRSEQAARAVVEKLTETATQPVHGRLRALVEWVQRYYGFGQCFLHLVHGADVYLAACAGTDPHYLVEGMTYPRKNVYCNEVIDAGSTLYISDPLHHPVDAFSQHNEVRARGWHFYIGVPLVTPEGAVVGTLCLMDRTPRDLHQEDVRLFEVLAKYVAGMFADVAASRPIEAALVDEERVFQSDLLEPLVLTAVRRVARDEGKLHLVRIHVDDPDDYEAVVRRAYGVTSGLRMAVSRAENDLVLVYDGALPSIVDNNIQALKRMIESVAAEVATVTWFAPEGPRMETDAIAAMAVRLLATIGVGST